MADDDDEKKDSVALCASCDRCRARKTKCDGSRPCGNCASKYMKKHKLTSIEGVDMAEFECVYSPAKRRGPVPGRSGTTRKANEAFGRPGMEVEWQGGGMGGAQSMEELQLRQMMLQNMGAGAQSLSLDQGPSFLDSQQAAIQQQLNLIQQLQVQQNLSERGGAAAAAEVEQPARRMKLDQQPKPNTTDANGVPRTIAAHTHLLELSDPDGSRLRAYYRLSVDELFGFPPTPTDEEYCMRLNIPGMTPRMIPGTHLAALSAARFAEVALGAIVHNEVALGMELCNAVVHCLRESVQEPVQPPYMFEVARSYFLLGVFRAFRGDMVRYFKYRRVCLTYISKLENDANAATLLAAVSFLDAWAYMIYNADEKRLPNIDGSIPQVDRSAPAVGATATELEYNVKTNPCHIASDPKNKNWIQGAPPVYLNNEAPLPARSLDALACAVRTCCDQANGRFAAISKEANTNDAEEIPQETIITPTTTAVLAHESELCSRNMVLSAFTLLQQYEAATPSSHKNQGIHLVISAMDAFLDNGDEDETGGFTDSQIQSLLSVCNTTIENPFLLHHGGPTYHMVSNAAVMLCHLLNGMYAMKGPDGIRQQGDMEAAMFEEVLDTFIAVRKLLVIHRRKLPVKLRCHGIPRPSLGLPEEGKPFIDLGETLLCACRGCQGFVLMACSPCVAAERARNATVKRQVEAAREAEVEAADDMDKELDDLSNDFNLDDDALLGMLSQLIST
mmetsp:Transcript_36685/g.56911  ORF Transcript_36685/g.56911 Transcript_36685/m.56911 type:complete len:732 (-) Transcript_36685:56-2251(-)|eukprot:CAMPEP_0117030404 /NCGR_PEP_ID=MMETSP0472-20121206/21950_1 /TAXON_ID=693140 ORGANISM="Tiarina fusus, Strain LIS" /NCGR_SAMPLE_ID=MMETSP0472 /ASSEMBLY_ACC=CAM_ASM_000603 /LENGTH=731 /DNA_ID=CAMNT_0004738471 /DNA_START=101 /DNA_END=2296 /DNA_ORIENTATION=-